MYKTEFLEFIYCFFVMYDTTGPYNICPSLGLASFLAPNTFLRSTFRRSYTYFEAKEICAQHGAVLHNGFDLWTKKCSTPLVNLIVPGFNITVWDVNDMAEGLRGVLKEGVVCTVLNWSTYDFPKLQFCSLALF